MEIKNVDCGKCVMQTNKNNEEDKQIQIPQWLFNVLPVKTTLPLEFELQQP